jgi:hypothetical protein
MGEIRCGEPDCGQPASTQAVVEMANLTGGMMSGLFSQSRAYRCPAGHVTTRRTVVGRLKAFLAGPRTR